MWTAGCSQPRMKVLTEKHYAPRPDSYPVELYQGSLETPHEDIAIIDSRGVEFLTSDTRKTLVDDLRARARGLGADAVTNVTMLIRPERGWVLDPQTPFRSWRQGWADVSFLRGTAIRFKPLMIETGDTSATGEVFDFAEGERPRLQQESPDLAVEQSTDRQGRTVWTGRRARTSLPPRQPKAEAGD